MPPRTCHSVYLTQLQEDRARILARAAQKSFSNYVGSKLDEIWCEVFGDTVHPASIEAATGPIQIAGGDRRRARK